MAGELQVGLPSVEAGGAAGAAQEAAGAGANGISCFKTEHPNHVWRGEFLYERTEDGRPLKLPTVGDEWKRRALAIEVSRSIRWPDVIESLIGLFRAYGRPAFIRSDNGPELVTPELRKWLEVCAVQTLYIGPGAPWENGCSESFDSLRFEKLFYSLKEAQAVAEDWRREYDERRPQSGLGYGTLADFTA